MGGEYLGGGVARSQKGGTHLPVQGSILPSPTAPMYIRYDSFRPTLAFLLFSSAVTKSRFQSSATCFFPELLIKPSFHTCGAHLNADPNDAISIYDGEGELVLRWYSRFSVLKPA
jgi:hypothetical protein